MKITKQHPMTGATNTLELPISQEQLDQWKSGTPIQNAIPNLTPDQREFLISGFLPGEYDKLFEEDDTRKDIEKMSRNWNSGQGFI